LMVASLLSFAGVMITFPFLVDILLGAICPGQTECSRVVVLLGALQLVNCFLLIFFIYVFLVAFLQTPREAPA
jgi:hypothetical protein